MGLPLGLRWIFQLTRKSVKKTTFVGIYVYCDVNSKVEFIITRMNDISADFSKSIPWIKSTSDIRSAAVLFRDIAHEMAGFRVAACSNVASSAPMVDADGNILAMDVFSWSDREDTWWRRPQIALNSPIPRICRYESDPFWCNEKGVNTRVPNVLLEDINLTKFSEHVQPKAIICVPVHMPFGQIGAVSFSLKDLDKEDLSEEFEKFSHSLEILSRAFITGYVKVTDERNWIPKDCRLSKREVQCVSWAALGKTDKEIATILSRSCATVRFHLNNAAKKLDAVSRSQTVFKASQLGYLGSVAVG